jgi:hypothetical protein
MRAFFKRHSGIVRTAEFALAAGAALVALGAGGDMFVVTIALSVALLFAFLGFSASNLPSWGAVVGATAVVVAVLIAEGGLLYWHFHAGVTQVDIIIVPPSENSILTWDPPRDVSIRTVRLNGGAIPPDSGSRGPIFRIKNLGSAVINDVLLRWGQLGDEKQLQDAIAKVSAFKEFNVDNHDLRRSEYTFKLPFLAPEIDNKSYVDLPIPYYVYRFAEVYIAAILAVNPLMTDTIQVPFRLTITWDQPSYGSEQFMVIIIARNMNPNPPPTKNEQMMKLSDGTSRPLPKVIAELTFNIERTAAH